MLKQWLSRHLARLPNELGLPDEPLVRAQAMAQVVGVLFEDVNIELSSVALDQLDGRNFSPVTAADLACSWMIKHWWCRALIMSGWWSTVQAGVRRSAR